MSEKLRRNGNRPACEPCRRSKLRCDHARPPCGRCIRRGLSAQQCVYHPAPMTQPKDPQQMMATPERSSIPTPVSSVTPAAYSSSVAISQPDELDLATGLVGMRGSLMAFDDLASSSTDRIFAVLTRNGVASATSRSRISEDMIADGACILRHLFTLTFSHSTDELLHWQDEYICSTLGDGIVVRPACDATLQTLSRLHPDPTPQQFADMSRGIFEQTAKPFAFPTNLGPGGLTSWLTGDHLRWETIAMYAYILGVSFASVSMSKPDEKLRISAHSMIRVCKECKEFGHRLGQVNDLSAWMTSKLPMLSTWCHGDDSYSAWEQAGDLQSMIYALNWHRSVSDGSSTPAYVIELRRRIVSLCHEYDKQASLFVGRPPRMTRQYCSTEPPLDLSDEVIMGPPEELEKAKSALTADGWDAEGRLHPATRIRTALILSAVREEVLELSLSPRRESCEQQAYAVLDKLMSGWASGPLSKYDTTKMQGFPTPYITMIGWMYLEFLYTRFLLLKLLVPYHDRNRIEMIKVSHDLTNEVLQLLRNPYRIAYSRPDMEFIVVFYAMPAASILLLELHRLTRQPRPGFVLNRSTIIKDIGALIAWCDWFTSPGQGNFELCKRAQAIFSTGLDRILDHSYTAVESRTECVCEDGAQNVAHANISNVNLTDDFAQDPVWAAWLETFGLEGNQWLDFTFDDSLMGNGNATNR